MINQELFEYAIVLANSINSWLEVKMTDSEYLSAVKTILEQATNEILFVEIESDCVVILE